MKHRGHGRRGGGRRPAAAGPRRERIEELHPTADPPPIASFEEWDLGPEIQRAVRNMDITVPFPIQRLAIGPVLQGRDVIAKAETGTGKTLAYGAPMMSRIDPARASVLALVLCPTRELAQQVSTVLEALAFPRGVRVALVVGGDPIHPQISALQGGAQVVVGTPGRVLDLYQQRFLAFPWTEYVVLDEADKMFEIGFLDDVKKILSYLPDERQTLLFSATFPTEVLKLARAETRDPVEVTTAVGTVTVDAIEQKWLELGDEERVLALIRMLEQSGPRDVFLVFCERRTEVDRLMRRLERLPLGIKSLHGGYDQAARFRVMAAFRTGEVKALVATDVASRGLDVQAVTHVVNYSVPRDVEYYTHRIGRTGRAGRSGTAITFVIPSQRHRWRAIERRFATSLVEIDAPSRRAARGARPAGDAPARTAPAAEPSPPRRPRRPRRGPPSASPGDAA
ncbi:MAG: DEAD/DEAH box helicase, partial [Planctomycetota bacterium]